jgi:polyisoprenoid-binding protein YceI
VEDKLRKIRIVRLCVGLALLCSGALAVAEQKTFTLDPAQTKVDFTLGDVLHTVQGSFRLKQGTIQLDDTTGQASGMLVVDATSGDSGNKSRDKKMHKEILESEKYPDIVFTPQHFSGVLPSQGKSQLIVEGVFNIHGQAHPMTLTVDAELNHGDASALTSFLVPYAKWGMKNPSTFILRVSDKVEISIHAVAHLTTATKAPAQQ